MIRAGMIDVNGMRMPRGIDDACPVIHFTAEGEDGTEISDYRVNVMSGGNMTWDTGWRRYENCSYVTYGGAPLIPKTEYDVSVMLRDTDGNESNPAKAAFETGFMGSRWDASWIEPEQENAVKEKAISFSEMISPNPDFKRGESRLRVCRQLCRQFVCSKKIIKARLYSTAHGIYNLYINGQKVSENRFAPENSAYEKILYYQTFDVTGLLKKGNNAVGVILADGWWIGRLGMAGDSCNYGDRLGFLMQLEIEYSDGSGETVCSDEKFSSGPSYICYSDLYIGEKQDNTVRDDSWMMPERNNGLPEKCSRADFSMANLKGQPTDPVCVTEVIKAVSVRTAGAGSLLIDFGQVLAGVPRVRIDASEGTEAVFEHSEILDKKNGFINNIQGRNKDQRDVLICRKGIQTFEPQFTYHGFRYLRITGISAEQLLDVQALVIGSPVKKSGSFSCSDGLLNRLQHCIEWSTRSNMISIPTDCPQREKLGWTGDIQIFARTGCFNYDLRNFLSAWLMNMRAEQQADGEIPVTVPCPPAQERCQRMMSGGTDSSAGWSDACVLLPWYLYESCGDSRVLSDNFDMMKKWLAYVASNCGQRPDGYRSFTETQKERSRYLWRNQYHFGDWLIPSLRALPDGVKRGTDETAEVVGSCFYAITVDCFVNICITLGKVSESRKYSSLLDKIRNAVREEYVMEDGTVRGSSLQGLYVMILRSGCVEGELKQKVAGKLVKLIHENGDCLDTGFSSVSYLLDVLDDCGRRDLAYRILMQTKAPSWLYMVKNGATSIWENWLGVLEDGTPTETSYDHYAYGCVGDWIYRHIGGIRAGLPGYRKIVYEPDTDCSLKSGSCSLMTQYGKASLAWQKSDDGITADGTVPIGAEAVFIYRDEQTVLRSGKFRLEFKN